MKKKILYILITIFVCGLIGVLSEIFVFNFKPLTLGESDRGVSEIKYTTKKSEDGKTVLDFNLDHKYIRQLLIDYTATEDVDYAIDYTYSGLYDKDTEKTFEDIFDNSFAVSATNLDATISKLSVSFEDASKITINKVIIDNGFHFNYFRAIFIFLALVALCSLFFFYKDGFRTEKIHIYFAVIASLVGFMIIVAQPAMTFFCWDDQTHFDRVIRFPMANVDYTIGEYHMSDIGTVNHTWAGSTDSFTESRVRSKYLDNPDTTGHNGIKNGTFLVINKLPYAPMAIGYHAARLIKLPFTVRFEIGKIFNLLFYVLLMTYAIKILVAGKRLLAIIALLPSNIFLASQYSYDPAVFAGISIFVVQVINLLLDKTKKFDFKTAVIMIASMAYACLAKAAYAPIILLVLLVPKDKFKNIKQSRLVKTGFIVITLLLGATLLLPSLDGTEVADVRGGEVSVKDQVSLIASHPTSYVAVLGDNAVEQFGYKLFSPNTMTNFSYTHSFTDRSNFYYIFIILLLFAFFTDNKKNTLTKKQRYGFLGITLLIILVIWSALYVDFTPVGSGSINGVQNRYFLPLLLPLLFCLQIPSIENKINPKYYNLIIFALITISMILMIYGEILVPYNF